MGYLQNLTRYFRQSLIDTDRACPDDRELLPLFRSDKEAKRDTPYLALAHQAWLSGQIAAEQAEAILSQRQSRSKKPLAEVELVMFPRVDLLRSQGGAPDRRKRRVLLPLGVFVRLDRRGQLRPAAKAPWIPREWLGPNQGAAEPIADVVALDAFISTQPFEGIETWRELVGYCTRMLCSVTGAEYVAPDDHQPGTSLFELAMHADYELIDQSLLQVEDLPLVGAKETMLKVLDTLGDMQELPLLYRCYVSRSTPPLKLNQDLAFDTRLASRHVGQMTGEFPLSPKQRHALHHFLQQEDGEILAVNGPPGTGKTTLLRSVVANLWTQAALDETEPPLIVAASNNIRPSSTSLRASPRWMRRALTNILWGVGCRRWPATGYTAAPVTGRTTRIPTSITVRGAKAVCRLGRRGNISSVPATNSCSTRASGRTVQRLTSKRSGRPCIGP
jgi:hypothetical protein